jgi:hypothetical protein
LTTTKKVSSSAIKEGVTAWPQKAGAMPPPLPHLSPLSAPVKALDPDSFVPTVTKVKPGIDGETGGSA